MQFKVLLMKTPQQELEALNDIRSMMERSSRFISLSGWSGIAAGCCALIGAAFAYPIVSKRHEMEVLYSNSEIKTLLVIAVCTFVAAFASAFFFTYIKSKKDETSIWGKPTKRLMWSIAVPLGAGGLLLLRMIDYAIFGFVAPGCLLFYGVALIAGSRLTLSEIKYLGYAEIILGCISLWKIGYGFYFWVIGFGILHIIYGIWMWIKYERK